MKPLLSLTFIAWRFYVIIGLIFSVALGLSVRMLDLMVINRPFLQEEGNARVLRLENIPAFRGMILDRSGQPLAISSLVYSIWMNPMEWSVASRNTDLLANALHLKSSDLRKNILEAQQKEREFLYIKRDLSPDQAENVKALKLPGVFIQSSYKRFYPEGEVTAHVVGLTNVDDQGQEGLELAYQSWLAGSPGKQWVIKDRLGRVISDVQKVQGQTPGRDLVLSIDRRLQYIAYRELMAGVLANHADSGSAVIIDTQTGEILAMVNQPSFNPNNPASKKPGFIRNRAVTDVFEPGSTMKAFSMAAALESGLYQPDSVVNTYPGWLRVGHHLVRDEHRFGVFNLSQILQLSSNVGISKIILSLPPNRLPDLLRRVGFGEVSAVQLPGERSGVVTERIQDPFALATLAFGYGISVTTLQLAEAYAVIAHEGVKIPLSIVRVDHPPVGERVLSEKVSGQMLQLLESVLQKGGTGYAAHITGYRVAGKTGTAWEMGANGYLKNRYTSSFVGILPASHPRLVIAVVLHHPQGKEYYGGPVSGPIFEKIAEQSMRILDIPPDDTQAG